MHRSVGSDVAVLFSDCCSGAVLQWQLMLLIEGDPPTHVRTRSRPLLSLVGNQMVAVLPATLKGLV